MVLREWIPTTVSKAHILRIGNLVYRIGEYGETIKAGSKYTGTAKDAGTIFLSIYESVFNSANTGYYPQKLP